MRVILRDKTTVWIRNKMRVDDMLVEIKSEKWSWVGHVMHGAGYLLGQQKG